jgi:uncharacterized protein (TIGR00369 family)
MAHPPIVDRIRAAALHDRALLPVHAHFGVRAVGAEIGQIEVGQAMGSHCLDRHGRLSPGAFLVGADAALGAAVASRLADRLSVVSLTLRMEFIRLQPAGAEDFLIRGRVAHLGDHSGFAHGEIISDAGDVIAFLSTHCAFTPNHAAAPAGPGFPIDRSLLSLTAHGDEDLGPLATARAGARLVDGNDGEVRLVASPTPEMRNSRGDVQGGVLGMLAEQALTACLIRNTPAVAGADAMELSVTYVRPLRSEQPDIKVVARPEHASRRFASAHAVGYDSSGRVLITASGSRYRG